MCSFAGTDTSNVLLDIGQKPSWTDILWTENPSRHYCQTLLGLGPGVACVRPVRGLMPRTCSDRPQVISLVNDINAGACCVERNAGYWRPVTAVNSDDLLYDPYDHQSRRRWSLCVWLVDSRALDTVALGRRGETAADPSTVDIARRYCVQAPACSQSQTSVGRRLTRTVV